MRIGIMIVIYIRDFVDMIFPNSGMRWKEKMWLFLAMIIVGVLASLFNLGFLDDFL